MDSSIGVLIDIFNNGIINQYHLFKAFNNHKEEIIKAYEQGYREGQEDGKFTIAKDISEYTNGEDYYNNIFISKKNTHQ